MSKELTERLPVIVFLDHDRKSVKDLLAKLKQTRSVYSSPKVQPLSERYQFVPVVILPGAPPAELLHRATEAITKVEGEIRLILVDLVFDPAHRREAIDVGRALAIGLRERFHPLPVGVYSRHDLRPVNRTNLGFDRFAIVMEEMNALLESPEQNDVSGDFWVSVFERGTNGPAEPSRGQLPGAFNARANVRWAEGQPLHRSPSFKNAAPRLVDQALRWLEPAPPQVELTELAGGFSGAFLVKAIPNDREKVFVVKIDEDPSNIQSELDGYRRIQGYLDSSNYLQLLSNNERPITLASDWWGAFAMEYEGRARPLVACSTLPSASLASIYEKLWDGCLERLYQEPATREVDVVEIVPLEAFRRLTDARELLSRYEARFQESGSEELLLRETLKIDPVAANDLIPRTISAPWAERVHGDLNCRNVLYDTERDEIKLLDFPHVDGPQCLAVDFAKAEAELILVMMDWETGYDCDFQRLSRWGSLIAALADGLDVSSVNVKIDAEVDRMLLSAITIRRQYRRLASRCAGADVEESYRLTLISRLLRYVAYPDLTPAKRQLSVVWLGRLLRAKWTRSTGTA